MPHESGSFDYKVINPVIRNILDNRATLNNTIQMAMPFIKATTTIQIPELNGGIGFTLGLHAIDQDVKYEDIYSDQNSDMPLIGYTYVNGKTKRIYAFNNLQEITVPVFDRRAAIFSNSDKFVRIPPPGITNATIGRNKNGLLASGQLTISIPSLDQLESLQKTFLIPGVGMILEWGQQFALESTKTNVTGELPDISYAMFPWYDKDRTLELLKRIGQNNVGLQEILNKYAYASSGQYMWMFGRVANFSINTLADGSFQSVVKIVGSSEDSWAYSTKNTVVPAKDSSTKFFCASETNSVFSYFYDTSAGLNLKTLLDEVTNGNILPEWRDHVVFFEKGNKKGGDPKPDDPKPTTSQNSFADLEDAYFITWRFFVNVVLNDFQYGLKRIFASVVDRETLKKIGMLLPYGDGSTRTGSVAKNGPIDDPIEPFVGYNKFLRSVDPSVMIIVNEEAAIAAAANPQYKSPVLEQDFLEDTSDVKKFKKTGQYDTAAPAYNKPNKKDRSFLSTGVWLNHKTIVECMLGGDTIIRGVSNLLDRMNTATLGYWQLTLDPVEPDSNTVESYNYTVVDANVRENSESAVNKFINDVHIFNKYVRTDRASGNLVGSELIECNIDLSLPKRLFSQIATLGLVQPEDLHNAGVLSGSNEDPIDYTNQKTAKISDPNDTLRELYAITILSPKSAGDQGPDLTILPRTERAAALAANGVCGKANVQTPAQTAGNSNRVGNISAEDTYKDKSIEDLQKMTDEAKELLNSETCKKCQTCNPPIADEPIPPNKIGADFYPGPPDFRQKYINANIPLKAMVGIERGGLNKYTYQGSGGWYLLHPDAAAQYTKMKQLAVSQGIQWTISSAYRDYEHQVSLGSSNTVATPGSSPHGWGGALDFAELYNAVGGSGDPTINARARQSNALYRWLAINGPTFGWYNPLRLADNNGVDEVWHWEYWGFATTTNPGSVASTANAVNKQPTTPKGCTDQDFLNISMASKPAGAYIGGLLGASVADGKDLCKKCNAAKQQSEQSSKLIDETDKIKGLTDKALREFGGLQRVFRYVEIFPEYMVAQITDDADGNFANAFGASPGSLSIGGDLILPGIAGLRVGELFWIDRLPTFYKMFGAFQILSLEDVIDVQGWKTKIHARFNYLGKNWKTSMVSKITQETQRVGR